jgi:hypothetical protein
MGWVWLTPKRALITVRAFLVEILRPLHFLVDYIGNGPKKCNGRLAKNHFLYGLDHYINQQISTDTIHSWSNLQQHQM